MLIVLHVVGSVFIVGPMAILPMSASLYAVALLLSLVLVVPAMRRASAQLEVSSSSPSTGPKVSNHGYAAIAAGSGVVSLLLVVVVVLMVWQP